MREASRAIFGFLRAWRADAARACRHQYGIWLAVPILAGCLEAHAFPRAAAPGFLLLALFLEPRPGRRLVAQTLLFLAWSIGLAAPWQTRSAAVAAFPETASAASPSSLEGRVRGFPTGTDRLVFALETPTGCFRIEAEPPGFKLRPGQLLRVLGAPKEVEGPTNPGQFDYPRALKSLGLQGIWRARALELLEGPGLWDRTVAGARDLLRRGLVRTVPASQLPLFEAALLGITDGLDPAVLEDFRASGMLHILAISGQHIGIICLILLNLFSLLRLPRKAAFMITGVLVAFYVPVSGGSVSVVRSALMYFCLLPSILFERPSKGLNNLALAAVLCLLWSPTQILSLGFQLSFGATFFLLLYSAPISRTLAKWRLPGLLKCPVGYAWPTAALSGIIFLGLFPLLSSTVHQVSPTSIAGNLGTVGLSSGMIIAGCLALMASPVPILGGWLGEAAGCFSALLASLIHGLAGLPGSRLSAEALPPFWSLLLLVLLLAFPYAVRRRRGLLLALCGTALFSGRFAFGSALDLWLRPVEVAFLDVGQGDAAVLKLPGATLLLDAGPADAGRKALVPYLRAAGINRLDLALVTHPDLDHYGGLADVSRGVRIVRGVGSGDSSAATAWKDMRAALERGGTPWVSAHAGQSLYRYGDISLEVLGPEGPGQFRNRNDNSLVCLLRIGPRRILFTGDMEREAQAWLLAHGPADLRGAILKVPHHGSDRTTDLHFLEALAPEAAILSAGRRNRFGHPGPGNLEALRRTGSRLFLTPRQGAILYHIDRRAHRWETYLEAAASPGSGG